MGKQLWDTDGFFTEELHPAVNGSSNPRVSQLSRSFQVQHYFLPHYPKLPVDEAIGRPGKGYIELPLFGRFRMERTCPRHKSGRTGQNLATGGSCWLR